MRRGRTKWSNGLYRGTGAGVKAALMKRKFSSATGSVRITPPNGGYPDLYNHLLAKATAMRPIIMLLAAVACAGCAFKADRKRESSLAYSFEPTDVTRAAPWVPYTDVEPSAQIHQLYFELSRSGMDRFLQFAEAHDGQPVDILVHGRLLAPGLIVHPQNSAHEWCGMWAQLRRQSASQTR